METLVLISLLLLGFILGSFLNVLISRSPLFSQGRGISVFLGRSKCDQCQRKLRWFELFPIFSYLFLRGKCRTCAAVIPFRYVAREGIMGILFVALGHQFLILQGLEKFLLNAPLSINALYFFLLATGFFALAAIFFFDLEYYIIPDALTILFLISSVGMVWIRALYVEDGIHGGALLSAVGSVFLFFWLLWFFTKGKGMGFGDVKLTPLFPVFLGIFPGIVAILYAFWIGAFISLFLLFSKKKGLKDPIPFGPFLVLGVLTVFFFPQTLAWFDFLKSGIIELAL